jgi:HAD superfamily hydrolase (TIGR01509 family)
LISESVLFDMDGTLVDSEPYWLIAEQELMARFDYQWTLADQSACLGGPLPRVGQYMSDIAGGVQDWKFFMNELIAGVVRKFEQGLNFMPGALQLLEDIHQHGVPMALVSASPRILVQAALDSLPKQYFQLSISSNDVTNTKPHPESYLTAATLLGARIKNSLVLEDSITGVTSGIDSGARVIAIPHLVKITDHPNVRIISTFEGQTLSSLEGLFV